MGKLNASLKKIYGDIGVVSKKRLKDLYVKHTGYESVVGGSRFMKIFRGEVELDAREIYIFSMFFNLSVKTLIADTLPDLDIQNLNFEKSETAKLETETFGFNN